MIKRSGARKIIVDGTPVSVATLRAGACGEAHESGRLGLGLVFVGVIETFWDFLQPCYLCRAFLLSFCDHVG